MSKPIAFTYDADTHCPPCATARFGADPAYGGPPEDARDAEGNGVGAIWPWDEWHEPVESGRVTLTCGTCREVIAHCDHGHAEPEPCTCDSCMAADA